MSELKQLLSEHAFLRKRSTDIAEIAAIQLKAWQMYANRWQLMPEYREREQTGVNELHLICAGLKNEYPQPMPFGGCGISIFTLWDGNFRRIDIDTIKTLIVAHLRNVHRDMEEVVYNGLEWQYPQTPDNLPGHNGSSDNSTPNSN